MEKMNYFHLKTYLYYYLMNNNIKTTIKNGHVFLKICDIDFTFDDEQIEHIMNKK